MAFAVPGEAGANATLADRMKTLLKELGVADPAEVLKQVRFAQLEAERTAPETAADVRASKALLEKGASDFLARLYAWFDQTMDRVSELFTLYTRLVTTVTALLVAITLQLDSVHLINRLSNDKVVRTALVKLATEEPDRFSPVLVDQLMNAESEKRSSNEALPAAKALVEKANSALATVGGDKESEKAERDEAIEALNAKTDRAAAADRRFALLQARVQAAKAVEAEIQAKAELDAKPGDPKLIANLDTKTDEAKARREAVFSLSSAPGLFVETINDDPAIQELVGLNLVSLPSDFDDWTNRASATNWLGVLLSAALLSLGGPFWYSMLQNLIKLRPMIVKKDDAQRLLRQTTQTPP
jgi:hypothetical protein